MCEARKIGDRMCLPFCQAIDQVANNEKIPQRGASCPVEWFLHGCIGGVLRGHAHASERIKV